MLNQNFLVMKFFIKFFSGIVLLTVLISCNKEIENQDLPVDPVSATSQLVVDGSFNWLAYQISNLSVTLQGSGSYEGEVIVLYDDDFQTIEKTIVRNSKVIFNSDIRLDNEFVTVFFPKTRAMQKITDFRGNKTIVFDVNAKGKPSNGGKMVVISSPDCTTDCDQTMDGVYNNLVVDDETVCLTGSLNGGLTLSGNATLKICGTANITNINFNGNGYKTIIVTTFGSLQVANLALNNGVYFENYSQSCTINGTLSVSSDLYNYGSMTINSMNMNVNGYISNDGTMSLINGVNLGGYFYNYGTFQSGGDIAINSDNVGNYCKMISQQSISINQDIENWGYMKAGLNFTLNGADIDMGYEAMISTQNLTLNGEIAGMNYLSAVKVTGTTVINGSGSVTGVVNFCDQNGIETNNGTFGPSVSFCQGFIDISSCNPEGIGLPQVADTDNDGVSDDLDDFPNNSALAFENYVPYSGYKTIAFEDLWPSKGDFDFNDVLVKTRIRYKSNAQNKIVSADFEVVLSALGAGLHNGLALQFLNSNNAAISGMFSSVTGASVDPQEANSILIASDLFDKQSSYYTNTSLGLAKTPDTLKFTVNFNTSGSGWEVSNLTEDFYIFRSAERGLEIHVANRPPTSIANTNYFGTSHDASNLSSGIYYKTSTNLPWGIELLDGSGGFRNPLEKVDVITAYPMFQLWATSKGMQNTLWYESPVSHKVFNLYQ